MEIVIRKIELDDLTALLRLMREFAEFEHLEAYLEVTEERLAAAMFGEGAFVSGLLLEIDGSAAGYALFYPYFASFRGQRGIYLEDIYLAQACRGRGLGSAMLKEIARKARNGGFERIDFQVLNWNTPAIEFYKKLGAECDDSERHFKFAGDAFDSLAD
ncbi:MAG TPA: GNAT family N-acetyltransferase [Blastocatellia bacterium]|nr:GNAT family N-acetyltransferase [Blastocatellia bacterium]